MASIGQIVYNVQDYHASGGYISTMQNNTSQTVSSTDPSYESLRINIFTTNLTSLFTGSFVKLGLQAPPGTKAIINGKTIMIGRTGTYELDEDIVVTSLTFVRPRKYELDVAATNAALDLGMQGFEKAETERQSALNKLNQGYVDKPKDEEYWRQYTVIQETYNEAYNEALASYIPGVNGIYKLPNPDEPDADENYEELYNVIIDFMY